MMRLRHKKPINSYVGQANFDSSQILDEDFEKNATGGKRPKFVRQRLPSQQIHKYAQILAQFVQTINQDYKNYAKKFPEKVKPKEESPQPLPISNTSRQKKILQLASGPKNSQVVSKQQQNIITQEKSKPVITEQQTKRLRNSKQDSLKKKEIKPQLSFPRQPFQLQPNIQKPEKKQIDLISNQNQHSQNRQPQLNYQQMMMQNPLYGLNPALFRSFPYMPIVYQQMLEQFKQNPNISMYPPQMFHNQYAPNLMGMNMQNCGAIPFPQLSFYNDIKQQAQNSGVTAKTQQQTKKAQNLQAKASQSSKKNGLNTFNKRASFHIAIAYNIHYENLRKSGKISSAQNWQAQGKKFQEIDPTFPARRIRQKKNGNGPII